MNINNNNKAEIVKALILCANAYLEMDKDSSDEDIETYLVEDDVDVPLRTSIASVAALSVPKWNNDDYRIYLKFSAETFVFVYRLLAPRLRRLCHGMPMVDARLQIMVALHKLTSSNTYRNASATFNMKKSTAYSCTNRVINALYLLAPAFIQWPPTETAVKEFEELSGFPGVVGNIGLCRLRLLEFLERNSKGGRLLQVICDSKQKIIDCEIIPPNTDLIQQSDLNKYLKDSTKFPKNTHLVANKSYQLHENIMVPYEEENNDVQRNFNRKILSACVVDKCIGSLLTRFESLKRGLTLNEKANKRHVIACCILHNICLLKNDFYEGMAELVDGTSPYRCPKGVQKRNAIACELPMG